MKLRFQGITIIKGKKPERVIRKATEKMTALQQKKELMVAAFIPGKPRHEFVIIHGRDNTNFWVEQGIDPASPRSGLDAFELQDKPDFLDRLRAYVKKYARKDVEGNPAEIISLDRRG